MILLREREIRIITITTQNHYYFQTAHMTKPTSTTVRPLYSRTSRTNSYLAERLSSATIIPSICFMSLFCNLSSISFA